MEKRCSRCKSIKDIGEFYTQSSRMPWCKACYCEYNREWRRKYPDKARELQRRCDIEQKKKRLVKALDEALGR